MDIIAVALLAFFTLGYLVLGGADIGTGMVMPYLGRDDGERRLVVTSIAPFFLANEVWLVAAIGLLAGAFPDLEGVLLHDLYAAFTLVLAGWVLRDGGLWLRGRVDGLRWRRTWDTATVTGSWAVALGWGAVLGPVLAGRTDGSLADPAAVTGMAVAAVAFCLHGLAFASLRLTGTLRRRARLLPGRAEALPLLLTSAAVAVTVGLAGLRLSPIDSVAHPASLDFLLPPLLIALPLLVAAQAWVWRVFRHRVTEPMYL
ncbi:cytochrome d ubiquinol oxidase subunit II [Streptomyces sp. NPDC001941]|uniref:cytochrome d ubiquinol oxidase subunit II n=1 Tax=Streptomyces sp. NPDC001941 TaxID=3154659 RepID=UPI003324CB34